MDAAAAVTVDGFDVLQRTTLEGRIQLFPARAWWPSTLGHPCDRYCVWKAIRWDECAKHDATLESIFEQGRRHQPMMYDRLEAMGFELVRESDRPRQYRVGRAVISGRIDGKLLAFRGERYRPPYIVEAKALSGFVWDRLQTIDDLRTAPSHWTRSYYAQGQLYCFLEDTPFGVFVLESKATGMLKLIPYELDYAFVEGLLQRVERLQPLVEQGVDPDPIPYDGSVCGSCGFQRICYPPRDYGEALVVLEDAALVEDLEVRDRLRAARDDYEEVDRAVKARFKREGIKHALAGPFTIEAHEKPVRAFTVKARTDVVFDIRRTPTTEAG